MKPVRLESLTGKFQEATVSHWYYEEGDRIELGDDLVDVSTDDGNLKIIAPCSGILSEVFYPQGEPVHLGDTLCEIEEATS